MGLPIGVLVPRLAEIKLNLGADAGSYGSAIAVGALGALAGNYVGSHLVHHFGSRAVVRTSSTIKSLCSARLIQIFWPRTT